MPKVSPDQVWTVFLGDERYGVAFRTAMTALAMIPPEQFDKARQMISHETTIGPMVDPSTYVSGGRFDNAKKFLDLIEAARKLRVLLPPNPYLNPPHH